MTTLHCQYLGNKIKYYAEIWYTEITDDADFDYGKKFKKKMPDKIEQIQLHRHFEDNKNMKLPICWYQNNMKTVKT